MGDQAENRAAKAVAIVKEGGSRKQKGPGA